MKCRDFERLSCDYLDDVLSIDERREADEHLLSCPECGEALAEADFARSLMRDAPAVDPPAELIAGIMHETIGIGGGMEPVPAGSGAFGWIRPLFQPILQPRFVMGMAMTAVSFSMMTFYGKQTLERWENAPSDQARVVESLSSGAVAVWDQAVEVYEAAEMFYEFQTEFGADALFFGESAAEPAAAEPRGEEQ